MSDIQDKNLNKHQIEVWIKYKIDLFLSTMCFVGFLGKNIQRIFNRFWNYFVKGFVGTVAVCAIYPVSCLFLSTGSFILGVLSPIWFVLEFSVII